MLSDWLHAEWIPARAATRAVVLLFAAAWAAKPPASADAIASRSTPDARPRVAVIGFQGDPDADPRDTWLPTAVQETLVWRLTRVPDLIVVPILRAHQARLELQDEATPPTWPAVVTALGADWLISGHCAGTPDAVELRLSLTRLTGQPPAAQEVALPAAPLFDMLNVATRWSLEKLGVHQLAPPVERRILTPPARSPSALEYHARAVVAAQAGQANDARQYLLRALDYDGEYRLALAMLAEVQMQFGPAGRSSAATYLRILGELARSADDPVARAAAELGLGTILHQAGAFEPAYVRYETSLALCFEHDAPYGQLAAINSLANLYLTRPIPAGADPDSTQLERFWRHNYRRAAEWQEVSLELLEQLGDVVAEAPTAGKLALTYERLGDAERALALHRRSLAAAERAGSRRNQASAWLYLGQWHQRAQQWDEALAATQRCLELADPQMKPAARLAMASIYQAIQQPAAALEQLEQAYEHLLQGPDLANQLLCVRQIAELRMRLGRRAEALAALQEAIDLAYALRSPDEASLRARLAEWKNP